MMLSKAASSVMKLIIRIRKGDIVLRRCVKAVVLTFQTEGLLKVEGSRGAVASMHDFHTV